MTINGINGTDTQTGQMGMNQTADSYSRSIQKQISNAQKQLQELSSNEDMTLEEKMKKRQEIQRQINDWNMQLRQHQMEQRREKQQAGNSSMDSLLGGAGSGKTGSQSSGLSQAGMTAIISAGCSMKQAKVQGSTAVKMKGKARVLESEIKLDKTRGCNTQQKEEELANVKQSAMKAAASQISTLGDANKTLAQAAEADSEDDKAGRNADKAGRKTDKTDRKADKAGRNAERTNSSADKADSKDTRTDRKNKRARTSAKNAEERVSDTAVQAETAFDAGITDAQAAVMVTTPQPAAYQSVDIRL